MNRRRFIGSTAAAGAAMFAHGLQAGTGDRPNLLLIIVDQMREPRWFPETASLPAFERLRREGTSLINHFTSAVPCSPSRASLFTGLHLPQHGICMNMPVPGLGFTGYPSLDPSFTTLGHLFQRAGYRTPYFGKWHLTQEENYKKTGLSAYGFEEWTGPDRDGLPYEGLIHDRGFTDQAIGWLNENGNRGPWFLTLSLINPHDIMYFQRLDVPPLMVPNVCDELPANFNDDLTKKPSTQKGWQTAMQAILGVGPDRAKRHWRHYLDFYYYLNQKADAHTGRALETLDRLGLAENTLVVFTSDHGEMAGSHQLQGKGPFVYQENNNVPLVFRWPNRIESGLKRNALSQSIDLFHTLPELCGIPGEAGPQPGKSLVPAVINGAEVNDHVLMAFGYPAGALGENGPIETVSAIFGAEYGNQPGQVRAIFDGRYKFARYFDPGKKEERELYDLVEDPLEMNNLAKDPGRGPLIKEMAERLQAAEESEMSPLEK